jgi:hypothetical protein
MIVLPRWLTQLAKLLPEGPPAVHFPKAYRFEGIKFERLKCLK